MFDIVAKEVMMKEISQIAQEVKKSKQLLHSQFRSDFKAIDGKFVGKNPIETSPTKSALEDFLKTDKIGSQENKALNKSLDKEEAKGFFSEKSSYLRSMTERLEQALGSEGKWVADGDKLKFVPDDEKALGELKKRGLDGIKYDKYAEPDFSPVAKETVEIDNMTSIRRGAGRNFEQADSACAKAWNEKAMDGRTDWTARDVERWREKHKYSWHERSDMKTMDLVPSDVHDACKHYGGCSECKARDGELGGSKYDE